MSAEIHISACVCKSERESEFYGLFITYLRHTLYSLCNRIGTLVLILLMACCDNLRRRVPLNFIALGLFVSAAVGDVFCTFCPADTYSLFAPPSLLLLSDGGGGVDAGLGDSVRAHFS